MNQPLEMKLVFGYDDDVENEYKALKEEIGKSTYANVALKCFDFCSAHDDRHEENDVRDEDYDFLSCIGIKNAYKCIYARIKCDG
ncbi:hypothetical protein DPMN_038719 [Dreissena polymorpha]|uniref:Uncharacterized protein n=1 Tax=Dreissena polymorpha TaxID=45954 RepID=A0A9D4MF66_DREPO|nr:hypothetical protein DPMN_038719 [Dreissena polymorpha]